MRSPSKKRKTSSRCSSEKVVVYYLSSEKISFLYTGFVVWSNFKDVRTEREQQESLAKIKRQSGFRVLEKEIYYGMTEYRFLLKEKRNSTTRYQLLRGVPVEKLLEEDQKVLSIESAFLEDA